MKATIKRYVWIGVLVFGLGFLAAGAFFVTQGLAAKAQIKAALLEEQITTGKDGVKFGVAEGTLVQDATTAQAEADIIKFHTMGKWGPYSKMSRDDPNRAIYLNGVTLRTALGMAVMGFGVANLAIGTGVIIVILGVMTTGAGVLGLYWVSEAEPKASRQVSRQTAIATGT